MGRCLVIDDSDIDRLVHSEALALLGYEVHTTGNGKEALNLLSQNEYIAVFCDVSMPDMNGIQILEQSAQLPTAPPFIMVTGQDDVSMAVLAMQKGAYGYLTKPMTSDSLHETLSKALQKRKQETEKSRQLSSLKKTDALTGLLNKNEFQQQLTLLVNSSRRRDRPGMLALIGVDSLSNINSSFGHIVGDEALREVAQMLKRVIRPQDLAARVGGGTFGLYLAGISEADAAQKIEEIRLIFENELLQIGGRKRGVTVTIGAAFNDSENISAPDLLNNSELALSQAKRLGSNRWHIYTQEDEKYKKELGEQFNHIETIKNSLENNLFQLHFQPICDLKSGLASHFEALLRMYDNNQRPISPEIFIKVAEKFGLINRIDRWVLKNCITKLSEIHKKGRYISLSINLSGATLDDESVLDEIEGLVKSSGVDSRYITFEITETAAFHNINLVQRFIGRAKQLGCRFALDDFGVGFSSFYFIKQLNVDYLKIDGSFIRNLLTNTTDQVFVKAMVEISQVFGMRVIAEWVENQHTADLLRTLGVDYGQGWHFGRPSADIV